MTQQREALLPCPFCGSADIVCPDQGDDDFATVCKSCGATSAFSHSSEVAASFWNRRAALSQSPADVGEVVLMPRKATREMTMAACGCLPSCEHNFGHAGEMLRNAYEEMVKVAASPPPSAAPAPGSKSAPASVRAKKVGSDGISDLATPSPPASAAMGHCAGADTVPSAAPALPSREWNDAIEAAITAIGEWHMKNVPNTAAMSESLARDLMKDHHHQKRAVQSCQHVIRALTRPHLALPASASEGWRDGGEAAVVSDQMIGQIEDRFPNWRSYRDLIDCIDCTLHELRASAPRGGVDG